MSTANDCHRKMTSLPFRPAAVARLDAIVRVGLVIGGMIALAILLRSLHLQASGARRFASFLNISLYYAGPAAATATLFYGSFRFDAPRRLQVLTACTSLAVSLYAIELILTVWAPGYPVAPMVTVARAPDRPAAVASIQQTFGVVVDARSATEVLADVRRRDPDAIPVITPANHLFVGQPDGRVTSAVIIDGQEVVPMSGPSRRTTILCNEQGQWVQYRADRHGFNNPDGVWAAIPLTLAVLGDSYADGYCVPPEQSFAGRLRHDYPRTLNLGVAGNGPLLMLATLTEYLPRLQPPVVLWCYFEGNDLENLQVERKSALLNRYLQEGFSQPALTQQGELDAAILARISPRPAGADAHRRPRWPAVFDTVVRVTRLTALRERAGLITPTEPFEIERAADFETTNMRVFREVLRNAASRVQRWNGQLAFVYLPTWERYSGHYHTKGEAKRDEVLAIARDLGIPIIDVEPAFRATGDPLSLFPFRAPGHYTENGHRLVEETITRNLQPRLLPDSREAMNRIRAAK